jgi:hypothetical protein
LDWGGRSAETGSNRLPEADVNLVREELVNNLAAPVLSILADLSQHFDLGEELLMLMREAIARIALAREETGLDEWIGRLIDAGLVACAQRDEELANTIASTVVATAHRAHPDSDTRKILHALLIAGAAFQNEDAWAQWLEKQLAEVAIRLPAGEPSKVFLMHLRELKKVLKLNLGIHVRAEALASAAN